MVVKAFEAFGWGPAVHWREVARWPRLQFAEIHRPLGTPTETAARSPSSPPEARDAPQSIDRPRHGQRARRLNLEPKYEILGISAEAAEAWAPECRDALRPLGLLPCAAQERADVLLRGPWRSLFRGHKRDNEFLRQAFITTRATPHSSSPLQFEIIDPNQVRGGRLYEPVRLQHDEHGRHRARRKRLRDKPTRCGSRVPGTIQYQAVRYSAHRGRSPAAST